MTFPSDLKAACTIVAFSMPKQAHKLNDNGNAVQCLSAMRINGPSSKSALNHWGKQNKRRTKITWQNVCFADCHDLIKRQHLLALEDWLMHRLVATFFPPGETSGQLVNHPSGIIIIADLTNLLLTHGKLSSPVATLWQTQLAFLFQLKFFRKKGGWVWDNPCGSQCWVGNSLS